MSNLSAAPFSEFKAVKGTFIKSSEASSTALPDDQKLAIAPGTVVKGRVMPGTANYYVLEEVTVNGQAVPEHLRFLHKAHWEALAAAAEPAASAEAPVMAAAEAPSAGAPASGKTGEDGKDAEIRTLLAAGHSVTAIGKRLKVGRARIKRIRDGVPSPA